ncbi:DUF6233 domain-containing protein [Streptomyces sp. NBC_00572]|uniref:DUF6233 domain-containing protein n=1 Tax=Streptomyces sp. NBC_00572 TaxID=2903664 RepID=UPI00225C2CB0|nr:DUF6233 domain-containing protein [Streptomyces sp. NBC_00572]MCX4986919.1 DUF6233 domain-containing protein [Streptomyces sp. NBC_00572]
MPDSLPPDLPRLRVLETWHAAVLGEIRAKIAKVETHESQMRPVREVPAGPTWVLSYLRKGSQPIADSVHLGDCRMASKHTRALTREQALQAITAGGITACAICRPDTDLGILD